jgi:GT2 family glycosyltransferase
MSEPTPDVAVVIATRNRGERLGRLFTALRDQTLDASSFEVIVVDDGSSDRTGDVLEAEGRGQSLALKTIRREASGGPAAARNQGWRAASARLIAFTDDDCVPQPRWLEAGLDAAHATPDALVQGRTVPDPAELDRLGPFSRTIDVPGPNLMFQTCNVFYPRALLERIGGFDAEHFPYLAEDVDLAWRAIETGAPAVFCEQALVYHAVNELGPMGKLRLAAGWTPGVRVYARHPRFMRLHTTRGFFWKDTHYWLARALLAVFLPRRWRALRLWLAMPYLRALHARGKLEGGGSLLAPYFALHDLVEMVAVVRGAIRFHVPVL